MRIFLRHDDGKEQKYDFEDTELGLRETQRVVVVRGQGKGKRDTGAYNIVLYNLSSNERGDFESGLHAYLGHKPFFGALSKAAVLSVGSALVFWIVASFVTNTGYGGLSSVGVALMVGFLTYPLFWWLAKTWDRITERMRYRAAKKRFLKEMTARASAYAPQASAPAPQAPPPAQPETPPEASPA
jgi:hypothetical protein